MSTPTPPASPIDAATLREVHDCDGDGTLLRELIVIWHDDALLRIAALRAALAARDPGELREAAHAFKSSCAQLGALFLSGLCKEAEQLGRSGSLEGADTLVDAIEEQFALADAALAEVLRAGG